MRLLFLVLLLSVGNLFAQKTKWNHKKIKNQICYIASIAVHSDSLFYQDAIHTYFKKGIPFTGYVIHQFDERTRMNRFEQGIYFGEEWIFNTSVNELNCELLIQSLSEFKIRTDTNEYHTIVTNYYDFELNSVHEIFIQRRYLYAQRKAPGQSFDSIFGEDELCRLPFKSFYENGNRKEVFRGCFFENGRRIKYTENGTKSIEYEFQSDRINSLRKEFDVNGKCLLRVKFRNKKVRGIYVIVDGKLMSAFAVRRQYKTNEEN